ncbi:single-pass membrane and coiled-coil domain-containing protein 2 isoform X1 [Monodelphis domestica]|uniref:single-pass membrane and coiled-coil domain-containing protein 2 isoform X1 n=1 Tax=Monodelphis domestica TaxID=13616 RepID=UPI0024E27719|nr:single-pass membrane and coiled-coil domain-containing protein 2 isoform X1 [Monodelphis domestica]XP_056654369.1 single-pass membrane and coiled-coil domain-containing protein 2 isoform X1 [Monodelphis domestica]
MEIPSQNSSVREGAQLKEWKHLQEEKEAEQEVEKSRESKAEPEEKTEELFLKMKNLNEMILLQMKIVRDELQQWIEKNNNFLKKIYSSEYTMQGLLREMTKIDYLIEKSDDEDSSLSGNEHPQKLEAKKWRKMDSKEYPSLDSILKESAEKIIRIKGQVQNTDKELVQFNNTFTEVQKFKTKLLQRIEDMMDSDVEKNEAQSNQKNGQKIDDTKTQDLEPLLPVSSFLSEEDTLSYPEDQIEKNMLCKLNYWNARMFLQVKKLGIDHKDWIEKNDIIVQKIKATEETVKNLLNEVIKMENQMEQLEANQCQYLEIKEELSKQEKIMMIKRELEEMNSKFVQVNPCNEAQELKRKLIVQIENFYKDMTVMNTELEKYQLRQLEETEAEMITMRDVEDTKPMARRTLFLGTNASKWKRVLWSFVFFYASTSIGFLCYVLFIDPTFIFETMIPGILGRRRMWELKELVAPFWNLEMEDLLPS